MTSPTTPCDLHKEKVLQEHLIGQLVANEGYIQREPKADYDRALALDRELALKFVQGTQPVSWEKLVAHYGASAEETFFDQLERALEGRGLLDVLRSGIKLVPGIAFRLCHFRPASGLEPQRVAEYEGNILSVMAEVAYSVKHGNRLDIVLFVNGLPAATMEVKNRPTGTTVKDAERQYRTDRSPLGEPLLAFKRGALVHFALDEDLVSMTTRLAGGYTRFLPFNRGRGDGAGNPDIPDDFRVAWLWCSGPWGEAILSRDVLLEAIGRFMHFEGSGKNEAMIFPRFHQIDAVRKLMADACVCGAGNNYLIQHSAGSGKSNTIGWLAHHAINLHDEADRSIFDTAIIVTDRVVLDRQLQRTVSQFEQTQGVVHRIDGTSKQLKEAIAGGARIIVTTIQKFSTEHLREISGQGGRRFAVIVDEAHSSQSGRSSQAMTAALTREGVPDDDSPAAMSGDDVEDIIAAYQEARGPQPNISFFAFTATPRNVTLERFGTKGADDLPVPFHLYSMRQAIEEGFILDVLRNYTTYKDYYELEKAIQDDPRFRSGHGQRQVARYAKLHPTAIAQKTEIIVEHFRCHVMHELGGKARAMVVAGNRRHALRYYLGVRGYIGKQGYDDMKALVAFSGEVDMDGKTYTEASLNGFSETELPNRFDGIRPDGTPWPDQYQLLVVAEKYQTGFDQAKLCAMYVDRPLAGLQAVQTLSRLNRRMVGKDETYILDFCNSIEDIRTAFKPWFKVTTLEANTDPNHVYHLEGRLFKFGYLDREEIDRFAEAYFAGTFDGTARARLEGLVRMAVSRFDSDDDEGRREEFRQLLRSYLRFYSFIAQIVVLGDADLEKMHAYGYWLIRFLPDREMPPDIAVTDDMLRLHAFKLERKEKGSASPEPGQGEPLEPIRDFAAKPYTEDEKKELSQIVEEFNRRHGTNFSEEDIIRLERVNREIIADFDMAEMLRNNEEDVVYDAYSEKFQAIAIRQFQRDNELHAIILTDPEARDLATRYFLRRAMREAREIKIA